MSSFNNFYICETFNVFSFSPRCGTLISQSKLDDVERKFNDFRLDSSFEAKLAGSIYIDVHFHIVYENTTLEGGYIPCIKFILLYYFPLTDARCPRDQQIKDQMDVLNADYGLTGLRWRHTNTTRTKNREWFDRVAQHKSVIILFFRTMQRIDFHRWCIMQ